MIVEKILEAKTSKIKAWPVNSNRASELGHQCLKYLVLNRSRWQEKTLHDARLQMIFDMGHLVEDAVQRDLREAGFTIIEQQRPFSWVKYQITGAIDMKLAIDGQVFPCEVKSAAPYPFESINTIQDMLDHRYHYMRKYPAQLTLYLLMDGKERGLFLFKNKSTGELKEIWLDLDYEFAESLVQKAETINKHLADGTVPEPMPYDEDICSDCGYAHICLPERVGTAVQILDDERLLKLLTDYDRLKGPAKEYEAANKQLSKLLEGRDKLLVGDWFITGQWIDKTAYELPPEVKSKYGVNKPYWKKAIIKATADAPKVEE